jgi:hypothetical protein
MKITRIPFSNVAARSKHEESSPARTLGSGVRIPFEAWMCVRVYSLFVLFCVEALRLADPPSKESHQLCIGLRN